MDPGLSKALHAVAEGFAILFLAVVDGGELTDDLRSSVGGYLADHQPVGVGVVLRCAAENDLEEGRHPA